jgi:hypothetical protein
MGISIPYRHVSGVLRPLGRLALETDEGLEPVEHPDHYTRLLAVGRLGRLFSVLVKRARVRV